MKREWTALLTALGTALGPFVDVQGVGVGDYVGGGNVPYVD